MSDTPNTRQIRVLAPGVVNKIAAGEVIERPASVVKEVMENAVDSGATRIDVSIGKGGTELIRIVDNGCGIESEQLNLAITSHATSKITNADDLFAVGTLGFRGEALASIASISHFTLRSRVPDSDSAYELECNGGEVSEMRPCAAAPGTSVEVRNLFFNTPVRRRYLRTPQTESGHITEAFTRIALAHPDRHFRLAHNGRTVHDLEAVDNWKDRIGHFFGNEIRDALIAVNSEDAGARIGGYIVDPSHSRTHNRMQYLFLNGRCIRDRSLQHALGESYRGLILTGRYPIAFLRLEMQPDMVDVNVHPCKLEVRLQEGGRLYSQLLSTIRSKFLSTDLTAQVGQQTETGSPVERTGSPPVESTFRDQRDEINQWASNQVSRESGATEVGPGSVHPNTVHPNTVQPGTVQPGTVHPGTMSAHDAEHRQLRIDLPSQPQALQDAAEVLSGVDRRDPPYSSDRQHPVEARETRYEETRDRSSGPATTTPANSWDDAEDSTPSPNAIKTTGMSPPNATAPGGTRTAGEGSGSIRSAERRAETAIQIQNRYLVCEDESGMVVIDQHALHERILYEALRESVQRGQLELQHLLVPEPVTLSPAEAATAIDCRETLRKVGVEIEPFGGETVLVTAYPAMLGKRPPGEILRNLVEQLLIDGKTPERRDVLDELLHLMSCKAAVKAGDRLSGAEITALIEHRELCQDSHHCPHGRPTALVFSREELDRRFKRI